MNERQLKYLEVLRATDNPSRARAAAGVVRKTVSLWARDEQFSEAAEEAQSAALDEVVEASRTAALAGDSAQMTNWLKIARPELRPVGAQVAVGVRVDRGTQTVEMSPGDMAARLNEILADARARGELPERAGDVVDAELPPVPLLAEKSPSGPESDPDVVSLLRGQPASRITITVERDTSRTGYPHSTTCFTATALNSAVYRV